MTGLSYAGLDKLRCFVKVQKDSISTDSSNNLVCKISCKDCDAFHVGQTCRQLKKWISEQRNHIRKNTSQLSITNHRFKSNQEFVWNGVKILDNKILLSKRLVSEMFIKRQKNGLNLQNDTEGLHHTFAIIVENSLKIKNKNKKIDCCDFGAGQSQLFLWSDWPVLWLYHYAIASSR